MQKEQNEAFRNAWAKIVAKAWTDESFKKKLLKNPSEVLKENGIETNGGVTYQVHENTDKVINLILPVRPTGEIQEEDLKKIAGATDVHLASSFVCGFANCH